MFTLLEGAELYIVRQAWKRIDVQPLDPALFFLRAECYQKSIDGEIEQDSTWKNMVHFIWSSHTGSSLST